MIYVASPYTHGNPDIVQQRFEQVESITAELLRQKLHVFSPIVHGHVIADKYDMPSDFAFWRDYCIGMLQSAAALHVIKLHGWEQSTGVRAEIEEAERLGLPVTYIDPNTCLRCSHLTLPDNTWCQRCNYPGIDDDYQQFQDLKDEGYPTAQAAVMSGWRGFEEVAGEY